MMKIARNRMAGEYKSRSGKVKKYSLVDFALGKLSSEESLEVLDLLERDDKKNKELEDIIRILDLGLDVSDGETGRKERGESDSHHIRIRGSFFSLVFRSAAIFLVILGGALVARELSEPSYFELVQVDATDIDVTTRSRNHDVVEIAYALLLEGDNDSASELLNWCVEALPVGKDRAYAHLVRGGMFLIDSKQEYLGVFSHFDTNLAKLGLAELQKVSHQSAPRRVQESANWLAAKGNLMIGDKSQAIQLLKEVEESGGIRQAEARSLRLILTGHVETSLEP